MINGNESGWFDASYCPHRLPCGYCQMMGQICPIMKGKVNITWTSTDSDWQQRSEVRSDYQK